MAFILPLLAKFQSSLTTNLGQQISGYMWSIYPLASLDLRQAI
jgi:hypothetical protein